MHVVGTGSEDCAKIEQFVLDAAEDSGKGSENVVFLSSAPGESDKCVQLVYRSITLDSQRVLSDALPSNETGLAAISSARVYAVQRQPGLVERFLVHDVIISFLSLAALIPKVHPAASLY
jgi:hypothetical protein